MSNCVNLKLKLDRSLECRLTGKSITWNQCKNCPLRKLKLNNIRPIKAKTSKLSKAERKRFSIFTDDLDHCIICGKPNTNKHEIFFGSKHRQLSIKYGLVIPLCTAEHHNQIDKKGIHFDKAMQDYWHKKGQIKFEEFYPGLDFISIFHKKYL